MDALVQRHALLAHKLQQQITPHLTQIAGDDEVVVRGLSMGIRQQGQQSVGCRRRHGRAHVVGIVYPKVDHAPHAYARDTCLRRDGRLEGQQYCARAGHSPLCRRRTLGAELQRIAVLPFCGAEMAAGRADHSGGVLAIEEHAAQAQAFGHGGTGPIQSDEGNAQLPRRKGSGDDLIEQVAAKEKLHFFGLQPALLDGFADGVQVEAFFRQFEGVLAVELVLGHVVEQVSQRPFALLFAHKGRRRAHGRPEREINGLQASALERHGVSSQQSDYRKNRA